MAETVFALFRDPSAARAAVASLVQNQFDSDDVSLISKAEAPRLAPTAGTIEAPEIHELNPAQNDYPRTGPDNNLSSRPPEARQDFNKGLERDDYNKHYEMDVQRENDAEAATLHKAAAEDQVDVEEDAAPGIARRAGLGLGVGAAAAVAAIAAPGIGMVLGSGALAAAVAMVAASNDKGTEEAGLPKLLEREGLPPEMIQEFVEAFEEGQAIVAVEAKDAGERAIAESLLNSSGAHRLVHQEAA